MDAEGEGVSAGAGPERSSAEREDPWELVELSLRASNLRFRNAS